MSGRGRRTDAVDAYHRKTAELETDRELREAFRELDHTACIDLMANHGRLYFALARWAAQQEIR